MVGDGDVLRRRGAGGHLRGGAVAALHHHRHIGDVYALVPRAVDLGQMAVDLDDDGPAAAGDVQRGAGGDGEVEVAVLVHGRGLHEGHVAGDVLAVIPGEVAEYHGGEEALATVQQLALIGRAVPGVVGEVLAGGVALHGLQRPYMIWPRILTSCSSSRRAARGLVAEGGEGGAVAVLHPVAIAHEGGGLRGRAELCFCIRS